MHEARLWAVSWMAVITATPQSQLFCWFWTVVENSVEWVHGGDEEIP